MGWALFAALFHCRLLMLRRRQAWSADYTMGHPVYLAVLLILTDARGCGRWWWRRLARCHGCLRHAAWKARRRWPNTWPGAALGQEPPSAPAPPRGAVLGARLAALRGAAVPAEPGPGHWARRHMPRALARATHSPLANCSCLWPTKQARRVRPALLAPLALLPLAACAVAGAFALVWLTLLLLMAVASCVGVGLCLVLAFQLITFLHFPIMMQARAAPPRPSPHTLTPTPTPTPTPTLTLTSHLSPSPSP